MNDMALGSPAMMAAMMVAMMLPSFAPTLWRYHRAAGDGRRAASGRRTWLFALGYGGVWTIIAVVLSALSGAHVGPWTTRVIVLSAGLVQCTRWKAARLARCRGAFATGCAMSSVERGATTPWRDGWRFGVDCGLSCAALTAILLAVGLMDLRAMVVITLAITTERLAPLGTRIARVTGAIALCIGFIMCVQAMR